jgi:hypothetical protein
MDFLNIVAMGWLLVRTYKHSKLTHLYVIGALMFLYPFFELLTTILFKWAYGCSF